MYIILINKFGNICSLIHATKRHSLEVAEESDGEMEVVNETDVCTSGYPKKNRTKTWGINGGCRSDGCFVHSPLEVPVKCLMSHTLFCLPHRN